jgi:hypothetical protein
VKRLEVTVNEIVASAEMFESLAPITIAELDKVLPIAGDRAIPTQWSGRAWRTEKDYQLVAHDPGTAVENVADRLTAGDIIFYPRIGKIGIAYGDAKWLGPFYLERHVSLIGKIDTNLDEFVKTSLQIIYEGPAAISLRPVD